MKKESSLITLHSVHEKEEKRAARTKWVLLETVRHPFTSWKKSLGMEKIRKKGRFEGGTYDYNYSEWWHLSGDTRKMRKKTGSGACFVHVGRVGGSQAGSIGQRHWALRRLDILGEELSVADAVGQSAQRWELLGFTGLRGSFQGCLFPFWVR